MHWEDSGDHLVVPDDRRAGKTPPAHLGPHDVAPLPRRAAKPDDTPVSAVVIMKPIGLD